MRILVASDQITTLSSLQAGEAIARGWLRGSPESELAVVPIGSAGVGFTTAVADLIGAQVQLVGADEPGAVCVQQGIGERREQASGHVEQTAVVAAEALGRTSAGIDLQQSSFAIGFAAAALLREHRPTRLLLDLAQLRCHDAGAGLLAGLGARGDRPLDRGAQGLPGLTRLDLRQARELVAGVELVAVVAEDQVDWPLLGLRGITSRQARDQLDAPELLDLDATLENFARLAGGDDRPELLQTPGAGAGGGAAFAIAALGGRISTGERVCAELSNLSQTLQQADLVVTGTGRFDFGTRGGGVVQFVADAAQQSMTPCIALSGELMIGSREMRTMGIESAYSVRPSITVPDSGGPLPAPEVSATELTGLAERVSATWRW